MGFRLEDFQEKRTSPRVRFQDAVQFVLKDPTQFGGSLGCDISEGGMRLTVNKFIPLNSEVTLTVQLGAESSIECVGRVVRIQQMPFSENFQLGLEFVKDESQAYIRKDIHQYLNQVMS
ncbi:MAG: PilZ domain-containing protein [Candidatus Omnitrophica bacterium]|nr:PilZ domain-containing protein [Candidatus Omnitrophota bacterium]